MRDWLTKRTSVRRKALDLYGGVVTAARQPAFYGPTRVADTPEGRFELVALHLFLVAERVKSAPPNGEALAQAMIEAFVTDMDDCMREMGVGDLTVPKRVKRAAAVFYERSGDYREALATSPATDAFLTDALTPVIARTMVSPSADTTFAAAIAHYVRAAHDALAQRSYDDVVAGRFVFDVPLSPLERTS